MLQFFKYFWFLCAIVGLLNILFIKLRVKDNNFDSEDDINSARRLLKGLSIYLTVPYFLLGIFEILGGYDNCFFVFSNNYNNIFLLLSWMTLVATWIFSVYWIFAKDGARKLIKYGNVLSENKNNLNETQLKLGVTLFFIVIICVLIFCVKIDVYSIFKEQIVKTL